MRALTPEELRRLAHQALKGETDLEKAMAVTLLLSAALKRQAAPRLVISEMTTTMTTEET